MKSKRNSFRSIKFSNDTRTSRVREWCITKFNEEWGGRNFEGTWQILWNGSNAEEGEEYSFYYENDDDGVMFSMRWL